MRYLTGLLLPLSLSLFFAGCAFTVAQSPETVAPGRVVVGGLASFGPTYQYGSGAGLMPLYSGIELGAYGRAGLARNLDAGVRLSMPAGIGADVKYQLLSRQTKLAVGLGASWFPWIRARYLDDDNVRQTAFGLYPLVVGGSRRLYGGVRGIGLVHFRQDWGRYSVWAGPEFFAGATVGRGRLQALPELHAWWFPYAPDPQFGVGIGLAVQYQLKGSLKQYENLLPGAKGLLDKVR